MCAITGIGIAADRLEAIFDMFTQVDSPLERSLTGLGIGLTLVKTLAEMHSGTVEVSSPGIGHGSEFVVRLPMVVETDTPALQHSTTEPAETPLRILIVDDNHDAAESLAMLLKFSGHETHTAHDGLAAVEAAAALQPDVICWTWACRDSTDTRWLIGSVNSEATGAARCWWP